MLKLPDNLTITPGPAPVGRVMPVLGVEAVASAIHELNDRATQFEKGREYVAHVISKLDDKTHLVKVDQAVLKMELGNAAKTGQTINLRYIQDNPVPTFLFSSSNTGKPSSLSSAYLSDAARLIGQYLQEAGNKGISRNRYEAVNVVSQSAKDPLMIAQGLRKAVVNSGLFYESHLNEMLHGARSVGAIMQEPQNQNPLQIPNLMSQQLAILEQNRLSWHGEVWPGQKMDWDVVVQERKEGETNEQQDAEISERPVLSEMTLQFPQLGKIKAKLRIVNNHVNIDFSAEQSTTADIMHNKSHGLTKAVIDSGLQLDGISISTYE